MATQEDRGFVLCCVVSCCVVLCCHTRLSEQRLLLLRVHVWRTREQTCNFCAKVPHADLAQAPFGAAIALLVIGIGAICFSSFSCFGTESLGLVS